MGIFQTIYNILITENERLSNILECPLIFIESYLYMLLFTTILKIQCSKNQKNIYFISFALIAIINILFIPSPYYTFVNVVICPVLVMLVFKLKFFYSILCEIIMYIFSLIASTFLILIYTYVFKIPSSLVNSIPMHRLIFSLLFYVLIFLFYKLMQKFDFTNSNLQSFKKRLSPNVSINLILGTIAIALQCYLEFFYIDYLPFYFLFLNIFILVAYFFISLFSLIRTTKLETTTEKLEEETLYNQTLTLLYDSIRGFKHDFNNIVQGIGGYISTNNMDGLKEYYSQILDDCQKVNNLSLLSPQIINNPAIYSLLTAKYHKATELGIKINLEVFMDLSLINMKIYELTRILGILIDNAIEASSQCSEKEIIITIRKDNKKNMQLFIIENTYSNKDINLNEIFEKGKTSKTNEDSKNHGLGLWEVRQLIKKNKNLDLYTTKNETYFKQQFEIYC